MKTYSRADFEEGRRQWADFGPEWAEVKRRFWSKVERTDGCWEWRGTRIHNGYGALQAFGKQWIAHRLAYAFTHGSIPDGLFVLHGCDNRGCVRPDHLRAGTHADNMADRSERGHVPHGEEQHKAKLTEADVRAIRQSSEPTRALARRYGVDRSTLRDARRGLTWKHVA